MLGNADVCRQTLQKCRCLQTAQQRFAVLQRAIGPDSTAVSENRASIGYGHRWAKIALDGRKSMRRSGFSNAILSTLEQNERWRNGSELRVNFQRRNISRPRQRSRCWMSGNVDVCRQTLQKCRCLQTAQQRFAVLQRAIGPDSTAVSENRASIGYGHRWAKIALDGRKSMRRSGFSNAILSTLDWIPPTTKTYFEIAIAERKKRRLTHTHGRSRLRAAVQARGCSPSI